MSDGELRKVFRKHLTGFDLCAIETSSTGDGVPDMNYARNDIEGWIENKACEHWRIKIRPAQVGWAERRLRYNRRVFVAVRRARTELWLFHGSRLRDLVTQRLSDVERLGKWEGNPAQWDWRDIASILTR